MLVILNEADKNLLIKFIYVLNKCLNITRITFQFMHKTSCSPFVIHRVEQKYKYQYLHTPPTLLLLVSYNVNSKEKRDRGKTTLNVI